ncbi:MAG: tRNA (guanosine(37)-N1)-methyltransferase TrmD [Lachnospiraceae bacterium]|nr:tRNA (guanosine(37)-N1)-methyltransferase TrmD [Lachnospiraceae bacterium]
MDYYVMTLFPEMIENCLSESVIGRAAKNGIISINAVNIRDYSKDRHLHVDDYPYGGGAGMVMQPDPVYDCYSDIVSKAGKARRVIYLTPQGRKFTQAEAEAFSKEDSLIFLCGHYEGVDERVLEEIVTDNISIGDYVLTGGELPVMVMIDAISRLIPGVLGKMESAEYDSFQDGLLEYPQYTRPEEFHGKKVPEVLLSGHHGNIAKWRRLESIRRTYERRPDLLNDPAVLESFTREEREFLKELSEKDQ